MVSRVRFPGEPPNADVAELADALDLGSSAYGVGVRLPSSAPNCVSDSMVECHLAKVEVAGSSPVSRSILNANYGQYNMRVSYIGNTPAFQAGKVGSIPTTRSNYAGLAQLVEHLTLNQGVPGSNP